MNYLNSPMIPQNASLAASLGSFSNLGPMNYDTNAMMAANPDMGGFPSGDHIINNGLGQGGGMNLQQGINLGLGGLQTIGNIIASFKALSLANKQFNFQKDFAAKNMANQVATYNTALADRARSRAQMEGQTTDQAQAYVDKNKLTGIGG